MASNPVQAMKRRWETQPLCTDPNQCQVATDLLLKQYDSCARHLRYLYDWLAGEEKAFVCSQEVKDQTSRKTKQHADITLKQHQQVTAYLGRVTQKGEVPPGDIFGFTRFPNCNSDLKLKFT